MVKIEKIEKWIKIIALWHVVCAAINVSLFLLVYLSIIDQSLRLTDYVETFVNTFGSLAIFLGLWRVSPWGWKIAVLFIPLSWAYVTHDLFIDYQHGIGLLISPFMLIDCLIVRFLSKEHVRDIFKISSPSWIRVGWLVVPLFILAVFLLVNDLVHDIIAIVLAFTLVTAFHTANRYRRKLQSS